MNYAEDRLDRKARGTGLWDDFQQALRQNDNVLLGRTLRDVGWIRHAVFHYSQGDVGDYAQMTELAGFPEIGVLALLHYRNRGSLHPMPQERQPHPVMDDPSWLQQRAPQGHCGCGLDGCGQSLCAVPMIGLKPVLEALETYTQSLAKRTMPTAHEVLTAMSSWNYTNITCSDDVPELLQFWKEDSSNYANQTQ
jgi:hypothetical protein